MDVACVSGLVRELLDDDQDTTEISLNEVNSSVLAKVILFCTHYVQVEEMPVIDFPLIPPIIMVELVPEWYADFINLSLDELRELFFAAQYLHIDPLRDLIRAIIFKSSHDFDYVHLPSYFAVVGSLHSLSNN